MRAEEKERVMSQRLADTRQEPRATRTEGGKRRRKEPKPKSQGPIDTQEPGTIIQEPRARRKTFSLQECDCSALLLAWGEEHAPHKEGGARVGITRHLRRILAQFQFTAQASMNVLPNGEGKG